MKRLGFFGGAFNPPTFAHLELANHACKSCNLDKVAFVPVGNQYQKEELIEENHRFQMLEIAVASYPTLMASNIELGKDKSYTTIEAFELIASHYPEDDLYFIMGADNFAKLPKWNRAEELVRNYRFIILERNTKPSAREVIEKIPLFSKYSTNFQILDGLTYPNISSKEVREKIKNEEDVSNLIPKDVFQYIKENNLYQEQKRKSKNHFRLIRGAV